MKYIRTKAGKIYDLINLHVEEKLNGNPYVETSSGWVIYKTSIVKQADTIEELCDEFVVAYEDGARIVYHDLEWAKTKANASLKLGNKSIIYGAVWCEFGLKYVARMNSEGVLELL